MEVADLRMTVCYWKDVRSSVMKVNPELAKVIDGCRSLHKYKLYKATYQFGDRILDSGMLRLPTQSRKTVLFNDPSVPAKIKKDLDYSSCPVFLSLDKKAEVFFEHGDRVFSFATMNEGLTIGLLENLDPLVSFCLRSFWSISAGARSLFMLPKISEQAAHTKLQKHFGFIKESPKKYFDHFYTFKSIVDSSELQSLWSMDVIFFSEKWLQRDNANKDWLRFYLFLLDVLVRHSGYARNKATFDVLWHLFIDELNKKHKRPNNHVFGVVQHLLAIINGVAPGYRPAFQDETYAPITELQKVYVDIYKLNQFPTIMIPSHISTRVDDVNRPIYYSIKYMSGCDINVYKREMDSVLNILIQTCSLCGDFYRLTKSKQLKLDGTLIERLILSTELLYFHIVSYKSATYSIMPAEIMPQYDPNLLLSSYGENLPFAGNSSFIRGCIMIRRNG